MTTLQDLLKPKPAEFKRFILLVSGQPKSGKTTLAYTASKKCPPPKEWSPSKPVVLDDILGIQFEPNSTMHLQEKGVQIPNILDWSDESLTWKDLKQAIKGLPSAAAQYKAAGVTTLVVDTLSTLNRLLLRDIIDRGDFGTDMERIRAYGDVDTQHYFFFDALRATGLNIIALVHLQHFAPFGEEGGMSQAAQAMKAAASKQVDKITANQVAGQRTDYIMDVRPKVAGHWTRLADASLVAKPERVTIKAGETKLAFKFLSEGNSDYSAGGRWVIPAISDSYLRPIIEARYGK